MTRNSVFAASALIALASFTGTAKANFQYIPDSNAGTAPGQEAPYNPSMPTDTPVTRQPLSPTSVSASSSGFNDSTVIQGFGKQVPLVIALREVVPASYQFAYADGINLGTLVNWKGGRPWPEVMTNVVTPLGLTATERNNVIYIDKQK